MFLYWCRTCSAWWDAQISDAEAALLRRRQRSSVDKPGVWHHPGMAVCPTCAEPSTQHLPTEHTTAAAQHRNPQFGKPDSERLGPKDAALPVRNSDAQKCTPDPCFATSSC